MNNKIYYAAAALIMLFAVFNAFWGLGDERLRNWDESRHGASALEMIQSGNYLVQTYNHKVDYWNLKPPLSYWYIVPGYKLCGFNLWGLRLFSACCLVLCTAGTLRMLGRHIGRAGALLAAAFIAASPMLLSHSFRNGDADALFITLSLFCLFALQLSLKNQWLLLPAGLLSALAFLTKSFHVMPLGITIVIWIAINWKSYRIKHLAAAAACALIPLGGWFLWRYRFDGMFFFQEMFMRDVLARAGDGIDQTEAASAMHYLKIMSRTLMLVPFLTSLVALLAFLFVRGWSAVPEKLKKPLLLYLLAFAVPFVLFHISKGKLMWYLYPSLTFLSVSFGIIMQAWFESSRDGKTTAIFDKLVAKFTPSTAILKKIPGYVALLLIACAMVWTGISETMIIRKIVKRDLNVDYNVFVDANGAALAAEYFSVDPDGGSREPEQKDFLNGLFSQMTLKNGDLNDFMAHPGRAFLLLPAERGSSPDDFINRNGLKIVNRKAEVILLAKP